MKQLKFIYIVLVLIGMTLFSWSQMINPEVMETVATKMAEEMKLDDAKKALFVQELKNSTIQIEALQDNSEATLEDKQFEVIKILKASDDKIQKMLSPSEYSTFKLLQTELKTEKLKGTNGDDKTQEVLTQIKTTLGLTDEKAQALGEIMMAHETKKRSIKAENDGNVVAIRNQIKTLNQKTNLEVESILTEEEYTKYLQLIIKVNQDR